eukprot:5180285-Amphidinium_carterae.3
MMVNSGQSASKTAPAENGAPTPNPLKPSFTKQDTALGVMRKRSGVNSNLCSLPIEGVASGVEAYQVQLALRLC